MSGDELESLDTLIGSQKRASLKKLFKLVCKTDADKLEKLDKELTFMQLFGKKYTTENDYLWRNELRLLMKYAAEKMMREELEAEDNMRSKYFLKYLLSKNLFSLLNAESDRIKEDAANAYDYRTVIDVCEIVGPYLSNFAWNDLSMQDRMQANTKNYFDAVNREFLQSIRKTQIAITGNRLFEYKEKFKAEEPQAGPDIYMKEYEDAYSQYLTYKLMSIGMPQNADPERYLKCLEHLKLYPGIPNSIKERFLILNNLSAYYFFRHNYEQALQYNKELIGMVDEVEPVYGIAAVYNYVSNLAHLGEYDEALTCIRRYQKLIREFPNQIERFDYIEASSYALKGDRVSFNALLPKQFDELSKLMQYHYRFLIALSHFMDKEYNLASAEVTNIERSIKNLKSDKLNYYEGMITAAEHLNDFFELYQEYKLNGNTPKLKKKLDMLNAEISVFISNNPMTAGLLFYWWMRNQVELIKQKIGH